MKNDIKISLNDYITISPSKLGWEKIRDVIAKTYNYDSVEVSEYILRKKTEDGKYREQMWQIMSLFGNELFYNGSNYIENTEVIVSKL